MATAAERQRAYRQRHLKDGEGARLSLVVSVRAAAQLGRLARHHGISKRQVIERLLADAEQAVERAPGYYD